MDQTGMKISINKKPWTGIIGYRVNLDTEAVPIDYWFSVYVPLAPELIIKSYGDPPKWITDIDKNRRFGYRIKDGDVDIWGLAMMGESTVESQYDKVPLYTTEIHTLKDRRNDSYITFQRKKA
jgi:hypothetical protein